MPISFHTACIDDAGKALLTIAGEIAGLSWTSAIAIATEGLAFHCLGAEAVFTIVALKRRKKIRTYKERESHEREKRNAVHECQGPGKTMTAKSMRSKTNETLTRLKLPQEPPAQPSGTHSPWMSHVPSAWHCVYNSLALRVNPTSQWK